MLALILFSASDIKAIDGPWIQMFNGKDLTGWDGDMSHWLVKDGSITAKGAISVNTFLIWKTLERDFQLEADVQVPGTGEANSGIQFHSQIMPAPPSVPMQKWKVCGPQADMGPEKYGALYQECAGRVVPPESSQCQKAGNLDGWNHYQLTVDGRHWNLKMNGIACFDYFEPAGIATGSGTAVSLPPSPGVIALQYHVPGFPLQIKNVRMKELNIAPTAVKMFPTRFTQKTPTSKIDAIAIKVAPNGRVLCTGRKRTVQFNRYRSL
jgi:hypothetical protein